MARASKLFCILTIVLASFTSPGICAAEYEALMKKAKAAFDSARYIEAERYLRQAKPLLEDEAPLKRALWWSSMGAVYRFRGKLDEAIRHTEGALEMLSGLSDRKWNIEAGLLCFLTVDFRLNQKPEKAVESGREAVKRTSQLDRGAESTLMARCLNELALALDDTGQATEAEALFRRAILICARRRNRLQAAISYANLGHCLIPRDPEEARKSLSHAKGLLDRMGTTEHPMYGYVVGGIAKTDLMAGRIGAAEKGYAVIAASTPSTPTMHMYWVSVLLELAELRLVCGRTHGVKDLLDKSRAAKPAAVAVQRAWLCALEAQWDSAWQGFDLADRLYAGNPSTRASISITQAEAKVWAGHPEEAIRIVGALIHPESDFHPKPMTLLMGFTVVAEAHLRAGRLRKARETAHDALADAPSDAYPGIIYRARCEIVIARSLQSTDDKDEATRYFRLARRRLERTGASLPELTGRCCLGEARAKRAQGNADKAIASYRSCLHLLRDAPAGAAELVSEVRLEFASYLERHDRPDEAKTLRDQARKASTPATPRKE